MSEDVPLKEFKWTNDCQGKKDFDGPIVTLSSRYWPSGGGFSMLDTGTGWPANGYRARSEWPIDDYPLESQAWEAGEDPKDCVIAVIDGDLAARAKRSVG